MVAVLAMVAAVLLSVLAPAAVALALGLALVAEPVLAVAFVAHAADCSVVADAVANCFSRCSFGMTLLQLAQC